jgi:phosphoribosylanthranilate isomerase
MYLKICGITKIEQAAAIAALNVQGLGFIHVPNTPRYVDVGQMRSLTQVIPAQVDRIGLFLNAPLSEIVAVAEQTGINGVQLHGDESPEFCRELRSQLPGVFMIKAFRVQGQASLGSIPAYYPYIEKIILDAYDPHKAGGTGKTLDWSILAGFRAEVPWLLAGGLHPDNVAAAIAQTMPDGIDLSSGVEKAPGDKDLDQIKQLIAVLATDLDSGLDSEFDSRNKAA